jgi:hypothetical protein
MKKHHKIGLTLIAAVFLTISSASRVAGACLTSIGGADPHNALLCDLTGEDADYCYYDCSCMGDCSGIADQLGIVFD